jgi:hypothetical protein
LRQAALGDLPRSIFLAVLEGLYTDGVSNEVVDAILTRDSTSDRPQPFVYACPICMPAHDALQTYRARPASYGRNIRVDTFHPGLPAEQDAWTWAIAQGREKGMQMLERSRAGARQDSGARLKSCAFCDGAAGACQRQ